MSPIGKPLLDTDKTSKGVSSEFGNQACGKALKGACQGVLKAKLRGKLNKNGLNALAVTIQPATIREGQAVVLVGTSRGEKRNAGGVG
jgi:hypothetical protein